MENTTMSKTFECTEVINLGSRYAGWLEDVRFLLDQLGEPERWPDAVPAIPHTKLAQRFRELRYVALVNPLTLRETRLAFPSREEHGQRRRRLPHWTAVSDGARARRR